MQVRPSETYNSNTLDTIYRDAFLNSADLVYLIDKNCGFIDCNQLFSEHLNNHTIDKNTPGAIYKCMLQSKRWAESQIQVMKTKDIEVLLSAKPLLNIPQIVTNTEDQSTRHYLVSRIPLLNRDKVAAEALLVLLKDVSDFKAMEEQMEKIKQELMKANANPAPTLRAANQPETVQRTLRILLAEDSDLAKKAVQAILMQIDCLVDVVSSETELHNIFEPGKYDLVLMDIELENTSGYILTKQIRQREKESSYHVPVVALTSFKAEFLASECNRYDLEGALMKPLSLEQARQLIQHFVFHIDLPVSGLVTAA